MEEAPTVDPKAEEMMPTQGRGSLQRAGEVGKMICSEEAEMGWWLGEMQGQEKDGFRGKRFAEAGGHRMGRLQSPTGQLTERDPVGEEEMG